MISIPIVWPAPPLPTHGMNSVAVVATAAVGARTPSGLSTVLRAAFALGVATRWPYWFDPSRHVGVDLGVSVGGMSTSVHRAGGEPLPLASVPLTDSRWGRPEQLVTVGPATSLLTFWVGLLRVRAP